MKGKCKSCKGTCTCDTSKYEEGTSSLKRKMKRAGQKVKEKITGKVTPYDKIDKPSYDEVMAQTGVNSGAKKASTPAIAVKYGNTKAEESKPAPGEVKAGQAYDDYKAKKAEDQKAAIGKSNQAMAAGQAERDAVTPQIAVKSATPSKYLKFAEMSADQQKQYRAGQASGKAFKVDGIGDYAASAPKKTTTTTAAVTKTPDTSLAVKTKHSGIPRTNPNPYTPGSSISEMGKVNKPAATATKTTTVAKPAGSTPQEKMESLSEADKQAARERGMSNTLSAVRKVAGFGFADGTKGLKKKDTTLPVNDTTKAKKGMKYVGNKKK
jgi:hypothetical protein